MDGSEITNALDDLVRHAESRDLSPEDALKQLQDLLDYYVDNYCHEEDQDLHDALQDAFCDAEDRLLRITEPETEKADVPVVEKTEVGRGSPARAAVGRGSPPAKSSPRFSVREQFDSYISVIEVGESQQPTPAARKGGRWKPAPRSFPKAQAPAAGGKSVAAGKANTADVGKSKVSVL
jgi:hypothetical protein